MTSRPRALPHHARRAPTDAASAAPHDPRRRGSGRAIAALGVPRAPARAGAPKIRIGYWPVAAGLPFFAAVEKGYFKEAGLDVEALKFAGAQQVMEAMLSGRCDGSANGTGSANLAIGEIAQPGLFKIFATNPSNAKYVLEEFLVAQGQPGQDDGRPEGQARRVAVPGIQNVTLAKTMLERAGAGAMSVTELPIGQHVARARRRPGRRRLHARADRHRRPPERHDARARGRRGRPLHPRRPARAVARRLGQPHDRVHQEVPGRDRRSTSPPMRAASSSCAPSPTRRASS